MKVKCINIHVTFTILNAWWFRTQKVSKKQLAKELEITVDLLFAKNIIQRKNGEKAKLFGSTN